MEDDNVIGYVIGLACDTREFFRWQCPHCGLDFKLKADADATHDVLANWMDRYLATQGVQGQHSTGSAENAALTTCPYCGTTSTRQNFLHPEVAHFIRILAFREIVEPLVNNIFHDFASGLKPSKHFTIQTSFSESRAQRPFSGPAPDDQVAILCLACRLAFSVDENWRGTVTCPACQAVLAPQ